MPFGMYENFITTEGLDQLKNYKYVSGVYSKLDYIIEPFWNKGAELFPTWFAPNLITLIGFLVLLSSSLLFIAYDFKMNEDQPSFNYFYAAFAIFFYMNFDAIDGKQARRLKKGSPLGQLFDHGCDCIGTSLLTYNIIVMFQLGNDMLACFLTCISSIFMFYSSNWCEYHTHILMTSNGLIGTTELEIILSALNILTGLFGSSIWQISLFGELKRNQNLSCDCCRNNYQCGL